MSAGVRRSKMLINLEDIHVGISSITLRPAVNFFTFNLLLLYISLLESQSVTLKVLQPPSVQLHDPTVARDPRGENYTRTT